MILKEIKAMLFDRKFWRFFKSTFKMEFEGTYDNQYTKKETIIELLFGLGSLICCGIVIYSLAFLKNNLLLIVFCFTGMGLGIYGQKYSKKLEDKYHKKNMSEEGEKE